MGRVLLLTLLAALLLAPPAAPANQLERELLREINRVRIAHDRAPLRTDLVLARAARAHSADMLAHSYFDHRDFEARMRRFGATGPLLGENLAWGSGSYGTARGIVKLWLRSPRHRANLLRPAFRRIGIGTATGTFEDVDAAVLVTADFAG